MFKASRLVRSALANVKSYARLLYNDYKTVACEAVVDAYRSPARSCVTALLATALLLAYKNNPTAMDFQHALMNNRHRLLLLAVDQQNAQSTDYVNTMTVLTNAKALKFFNFFFFTLLFQSDVLDDCDLFAVRNVISTMPKFLSAYVELKDVGAFGTWFAMERAMRNYDEP